MNLLKKTGKSTFKVNLLCLHVCRCKDLSLPASMVVYGIVYTLSVLCR